MSWGYAYDRWKVDGPRVSCDDCGRSLGRLHDGRGERDDGRRTCDACEAEWRALFDGDDDEDDRRDEEGR